MGRGRAVLFLFALACGDGDPVPVAVPAGPVQLTPAERLVRVSMAVRGVRPSVAELDRMAADPDAIEEIVDEYLDSPEFLQTVKDLHAELYHVRVDTQTALPALGPMAAFPGSVILNATMEEPLELVAHIVGNDRPYTEILTADYAVADAALATIYGLAHDPAGPAWQETRHVDGREHAGLLSVSEIFRRHASAGNNFERHRANFVAAAFLCEDFASREVTISVDLDLSDPIAVADALSTDPACVACHKALDPLASAFWGYKQHLDPRPIELAMTDGCHIPPEDEIPGEESPFDQRLEDYCYPVRFYTPTLETMYRDFALPEPGYYGTPFRGLAELGSLMADDPRFHQCSVRHFVGWLRQVDESSVPFDEIAERTAEFAASGFSAKALVKSIVLADSYATVAAAESGGTVPMQVVRPEQYARTIEQLTGFQWLAAPAAAACAPSCVEQVDLARSDDYGFRSLAGGIDGEATLRPTHQPTPTRLLAMARHAEEAAGYAVSQELVAGAERRLFAAVTLDTTEESAVRQEIASLHARVLGLAVATDSPDVDEMYTLFSSALARGDTVTAWSLVVSTLLRDPRMLFY